jgi:hypothetical protein
MDARDDLLKLENQLCFALVTAARATSSPSIVLSSIPSA